MRWLVFLVACGSTHATPTPIPTPTPTPTPLPTPSPTPTEAPPPIATVDTPAPVSLYGEDLEAWLKKNDVKPPKDLARWGSCDVVRDNVLFCRSAPMESLPSGESVFPLRVVYARTGLALTAPIAAGPMDNLVEPGGNPDDYQYIVLDAALDAAGTTLTISEKPGKTCDGILAQYKLPELFNHRRMVQKACAARGRYVLHDGKLVRAP